MARMTNEEIIVDAFETVELASESLSSPASPHDHVALVLLGSSLADIDPIRPILLAEFPNLIVKCYTEPQVCLTHIQAMTTSGIHVLIVVTSVSLATAHIMSHTDSRDISVFILSNTDNKDPELYDNYPSLVDVCTEREALIENLREHVHLEVYRMRPADWCMLSMIGLCLPCVFVSCFSKRLLQWFWYKKSTNR